MQHIHSATQISIDPTLSGNALTDTNVGAILCIALNTAAPQKTQLNNLYLSVSHLVFHIILPLSISRLAVTQLR